MTSIKAYISAGSNLGNRKANLEYALGELDRSGTVLQTSSYFETEPVGYANQPWFLNLAIELETRLEPPELLHLCVGIEDARSRKRSFPNSPRTLDLDILLYGDIVVREENLIIPHPRMTERNFVLEPLAQIAPDLIHPILKQSIRSLLETCTDTSQARRLTAPTRFRP
ncbi:MAG: 2-amino-4-hydroxy-6-hydroxymethyldihydropteridine diphosphokinase [Acidobacteria bacterium]|nr:2-amino-4-hydroxy-6-hydroxymethyldihydropteridine diphosphokinase [Acidobacteriota bacterium]